MKLLYINGAFREGSRTARIAGEYLKNCGDEITEIPLGSVEIHPLDEKSLAEYNGAVENHCYDGPMFDFAKQFAEADRIVIAVPFWNLSIPAVLHSYLELVCTQGITFDMSPEGSYVSLCRAKKLTYITTAGGFIPEQDHGFGYIKTLSDMFWRIPELEYIKAEGLDIAGTDVEEKLARCLMG